ncbi:type VI secretion system membrane subunit TssM [Bacillus subtilis subsp. subtilis]|nr:type VI secretion system membrane subunit TssM [Bacillus subtilis subsp. subtilis]
MGDALQYLRRGGWVIVLGALLAAALVWFGGPYLGIAGHAPLQSVWARVLVLLVAGLLWLGGVFARRWHARRQAQRMGVALEEGQAQAHRAAGERRQLESRFQEALQLLRRRRGGSLHRLPWYAVIGPPGSGKSTLLQNSGLHFPLADRFGSESVRGVGGTRQCDWWFTDEAVFLDTAGRYTTQDADQAIDAGGWLDFLRLLRRHRRRRPLNGVIVTMSLSDLLLLDEAERAQHAQAIRRRLDELHAQLQVQVPVYLVVTKCDLLAGFGEFFDDLGPQQRSQVWGTTFALDKTLDGSAARGFADAYARLLDRLNARVLQRLHDERERGRRAAVLAFPPQFAALGENARPFVEAVFNSHAYGAPPLLRGVYFTSGTQEGTPIDRMLGAVARSFGLDPARAPVPSAAPRTFFVEQLLRAVVLRESGLAGFNPRLARRRRWLRGGAYAAIVVATVGVLLGMAGSYQANRAYLAQAGQALAQRPQTADPSAAVDLRDYLARAVQRVQATGSAVQAAAPPGTVPWRMRWGLYQGQAVGAALEQAYVRELNAVLLPGLVAQLRTGLKDSATDPQALYYYLKGYLMLGDAAHLEATQLGALAGLDARRRLADDPVLADAYQVQLRALLDTPGRLRAIRPEPLLVQQARSSLNASDLATLVYSDLSLSARALPATAVRLDQSLGLLGDVFQRRSGQPLSAPWPALYTQPVFARLANQGIDEAVARFVADDWVLGPRRIDALGRARLSQQVLQLYERDYIRAWSALLADLQLAPASDSADASAQVAKLAGPASPLRLLLALVRDQTQDLLRAPPASPGGDAARAAAAKLAQQGAARTSALQAVLGTAADTAAAAPPGRTISAHFAALSQLCSGAAGATPLDAVLATFARLGERLLQDPAATANADDPTLLLARQQAAQLPPPVAGWLLALTGHSADLIGAQAQAAIDAKVASQVRQDCAAFVAGRYPFDPAASAEIPTQNFGELFGPGGRFDSLYRDTLAPLLDTSGARWQWKTPAPATASDATLPARMQVADAIKRRYFRSGNLPEVDFTLLAPSVDATVARLDIEIDGQRYQYREGMATGMPMTWPGPTPGHVSIVAYDAAGERLGGLDFQGDWALFRALQAGQLQAASDLRYVARFDLGGHRAEIALQARNLRHPFLDTELARFRCGA